MCADTTPLRKIGERQSSLADVEAKTPQDHYEINSNGLYSNHQYTDIALILKKNILN